MGPIFIISFDCEGNWGMADNPDVSSRSCLTNNRLNIAYKKIIDLLDRYSIKATFAFVGAFTMSVDEYWAHSEWFEDDSQSVRDWLRYFKQDIQRGNFEGWLNPEPITMVAQARIHEIGAHGFSHIPLSEKFIDRGRFFKEMAYMREVSHFKDRELVTFIYPRNIIGYRSELAQSGIIGYRQRLPAGSFQTIFNQRFERIARVATEFNLRTKAQPHARRNDLVEIPSGYFLNWRNGFRKKVPIKITLNKWKHIIFDAVKNNRVAHLWTHPHNFVTGENMYNLLEEILKIVFKLKNDNSIKNLTQKDYVKMLT